jgi:hypothetical protein
MSWTDYGTQHQPDDRHTYLRGGPLDVVGSIDEVQHSPATSSCPLTSRYFKMTLDDIERLQNEADDDDRPSAYARQLAINVLRDAATYLGLDFPRAIPVVGPNNSLRLHWNAPGREVRVVFGGTPENKTYLYWESSAGHGADYSVDGRRLADSLRGVPQGM